MKRVIAVYGTLRKGRKFPLVDDPEYKGTSKFLMASKILNAQLYTNDEITYWPVITNGSNSIDCELYEVSEITFQSLKRGEEMNHYHTRHITVENGMQAYAWFYDTEQVENNWNPVNKY